MKYKGNQVKNDNIEYVVIPRMSGDIVFQFRPVLDYKHFDKLCPEPEPPTIVYPDGEKGLDYQDKKYKQKLIDHTNLRAAYVFLTSVKDSDIEWDTVSYDDPNTWVNYAKELKDSEFTDAEIGMMFSAIRKVNSLDDDHLEVAKNRFLALLAEQKSHVPS